MTHRKIELVRLIPAFIVLAATAHAAHGDDDAEFVRLMNHGKALLENRDSAGAIQAFESATRLQPKSAPALRNLARASLLADKNDAAIEALDRAAAMDAGSAATHYLRGIAYAHKSEFERAVPKFEDAARLDPATAAVRFQLALSYQAAGNDSAAVTQFKETVRLDPMHAAAWFKLATYARQSGDRDESLRCQREFMRLRKLLGDATRNADSLELCRHTRPEAAVFPVTASGPSRPEGPAVKFRDVSAKACAASCEAIRNAALLEIDEAGRPVLFTVREDGQAGLLDLERDGRFRWNGVEVQPADATPIELKNVIACVVGDFFDEVPKGVKYDAKRHALNDVLVLTKSGCRVLLQTTRGSFQDVSDRCGLANAKIDSAVWADTDHDGDLDLLAISGGAAVLWQNNGNGTFKNVTSEVGIPALDACIGILAMDFDQDEAVDLAVVRGTAPTIVLRNQRAGLFARMAEPPGPWPSAMRIAADDFDNDGFPDAALLTEDAVGIIYGGDGHRERLTPRGAGATGVFLLDYDNDGWLDILVTREPERPGPAERFSAFHNDRGAGWHDATGVIGLVGLSPGKIHSVIPADFDGDGDTDLFVLVEGGPPRLIENDGGNGNQRVQLRLLTQKTNPSAFGTHVELRRGTTLVSRTVTSPVVEIGVGSLKRLDSLQIVWTNGVIDNQLDVAVTPSAISIIEKNVATGSCPFLYAWNGREFQFVTDILGNSPIGLPQTRERLLPADPEEMVIVGREESLALRDGHYELEVTSEFMEALYLDQVELFAVDHAPDEEVHVTDKIEQPPFPPSAVRVLSQERRPASVIDDGGDDLTQVLSELDGRFAPAGSLLPPPLRGLCQPASLVLDFGDDFDSSGTCVLALTGWLRYGQASTNIAASQNPDLRVIAPTIAVEAADGSWRTIGVTVGMPAGKTKTILCDLTGRLPPKSRRLRLTNSFEIHWDRIAMFSRLREAGSDIHPLRLCGTELRWRGFSRMKESDGWGPETPIHGDVRDRPLWRGSLQGWCTRYGDVMELVSRKDDRLAIINGGDAMRLRFAAEGLPPRAADRKRTFVFRSFGWEKDGDYNVVGGNMIEPLPFSMKSGAVVNGSEAGSGKLRPTADGSGEAGSDPAEPSIDGSDWRSRYNTRWSSGNRFRP